MNLITKKIFNFKFIINLIFLIFVFIYYCWVVTSGNFSLFKFTDIPITVQSHMADAFLNKQLSMTIEPSNELLALKNPFDPIQNAKYRLHDASLYNGKYYYYFSPIVAFLMVAPFKALTGYYISDEFLVFLFCYLGFIFSYFSFLKILQLVSINVSIPFNLFSGLILATVTTVPFLLCRPLMYEVCISAAYGFLMISVYLFINLLSSDVNKFKLLLLGLFFGFVFFSRPNQIVAIIFLNLTYIFYRYYYLSENCLVVLRASFFILLPQLLIGLIMSWYNYARFDSVIEFGASYQLAGMNVQEITTMSLAYIPLNLFHYFTQSIPYDLTFPFFHPVAPKDPFTLPFPFFYEPTVGLFSFPIYWLIFLPLFSLSKIMKAYTLPLIICIIFIISSFLTLLVNSTMVGVTMRYIVDFSPLLLLSILVLFVISRDFVFSYDRSGYLTSSFIFYSLALSSIMISFFMGMSGYYNSFYHKNIKLYSSLKNIFTIHIPYQFIPMYKGALPDYSFQKLNFSSGGNGLLYLKDGWSTPENWGIWSIGNRSLIILGLPIKSFSEFEILINARVLSVNSNLTAQTVSVIINGINVGSLFFNSSEPTEFKINLTNVLYLDVFEKNERGLFLEFINHNPLSPSIVHGSDDMRELGIGLISFQIIPKS